VPQHAGNDALMTYAFMETLRRRSVHGLIEMFLILIIHLF